MRQLSGHLSLYAYLHLFIYYLTVETEGLTCSVPKLAIGLDPESLESISETKPHKIHLSVIFPSTSES
jgi:hypothetical protein